MWLERFAYRNSTEIIALAPGMKDAIANIGYPADRITVIPNGSDANIISSNNAGGAKIRSEYDWLGGRKLILYCGALGRANGVGYLARLAAQVRVIDPEIRFAVIGDGAEKQFIERIAQDCHVLGETFFMLGTMPKSRVADWLSAADMTTALFTGPRIVWKDATQNKFFDSLAAGKPIANNFDGWQCQIAINEGVGIILPADDLVSASQILYSTISDDDWMTNAGLSARRLAATRFSMDKHAAELKKVLERAAASS